MRILVIHGSMRKGNTYKLTQEVIMRLKKHENVDIREINVNELDLPFCVSCHTCFETGEDKCPHKNIMQTVTDEIKTCDALILSGAVYSLHLNAAMKNLIDHLSFYFHRPYMFDKKGLIVTTTAGAADKTIAKYLKTVMGHWGVGNIKSISCKIQTYPFSLTPKQVQKIDKTTDEFYNIILNDKTAPPSFDMLAVHNAFRGMNASEVAISECDRAYWHSTGLINKVYPHKIGFLKFAFGTLVFKIMKKVISKNVKIDKSEASK